MSARTTTDTTPTLAGRLDAARKAEAVPQQRAAELESALTAAIERRDFAEATRLEAELQPVKEQAALAAAVTRALAEGQAAVDTERFRRQALLDGAEQQERAQSALGECILADRRALAGIEESLAQMRASLLAAQEAFREAQAWERQAGTARQQAAAIRGQLAGEAQFARTTAPNHASVLADREPLVRELVKWRA